MKRIIIVLILFVAAFLRFYNLSNVPPTPSLDEVSIGYNAYSILKTGKDEYGTSFPLLLRAYDDFRPALYVYLTIPFVWVFGLTTIAVRFPSVLMSLLTVYVVYVLGKRFGSWIGEIAAFVLAISPWHIYISRLGHEANLGLTLVVLGAYWLFTKQWILSAALFGLSLHGYQSEKIISPLLVVFGTVLFWKEIAKDKIKIAGAIALGALIVLPAIYVTISPQGLTRFRGTRAPTYTVVNNYISHFSPRWLFWGGDREAHKVPGLGLLYFWEAPLLLLGLWGARRYPFLLVWALTAPIPASLATQAPHAMRAYTAIPAIQLIEALGIWMLMKKSKGFSVFVLGILVVSSLLTFWRGYFIRFPIEQSDSFQYAMKGAVQYALEHSGKFDRVEFSHQGSLYQSYMFFLFYSRFDPGEYQHLGGTQSGGYEATHYVGNYAFGFIPDTWEKSKSNVLYFYDAGHIPNGMRSLETFRNLDGTPAIIAATL